MSALHVPARADAAVRLEMLRSMRTSRKLEERIGRWLDARGARTYRTASARGQEAVSVGVALAMQADDLVTANPGDVAVFLARGTPLRAILALWLGRTTSTSSGRGAGVPMCDRGRGILASAGRAADTIPVAAGVAMAFQRAGDGRVAFCIFEEPATARGDWHEGINLAAVQDLPVVYVCCNDRWSDPAASRLQEPIQRVSDRAVAYGIPSVTVDGTDVVAVFEAVGDAAARARKGAGPSLVEGLTFQPAGSQAHGEAWKKKDAIEMLEGDLKRSKLITPARLADMDEEIEREIDEALAWAEAQPEPDPGECLDEVYHHGAHAQPRGPGSALD